MFSSFEHDADRHLFTAQVRLQKRVNAASDAIDAAIDGDASDDVLDAVYAEWDDACRELQDVKWARESLRS